jgi:DegV family protein with EDD domain
MPVAVITDSAASVPADLAARLRIRVVPMLLTVDGRPCRDGELALEAVLAAREVTTSGPTPTQLAEAIREADTGDGVLVCTVARTMSSTYDAARLAAEHVGGDIAVLDTQTAAGAEGLVATHAARAALDGAGLADVVDAANRVVDRVRLVATLDSLDRLVASGRVPQVAAWAGRLLHVQPLFEFRAGSVRRLRPAFTRDAALERIISAWRRSRPPDGERPVHVAALHALDPGDAEWLLDHLRKEVEPASAFVGEFSAVMVAHTGPGLVGLAWWWEG